MNRKALRWLAPALALLSAAVMLTIATTSSPLYATNFWPDTNIYFTIGRGMVNGLMPYRDLFDHKGPLLYIVYALAAWITQTSFFGVFLLEILSLTATLLIAYHAASLCGKSALNLLLLPVMAAVIVASDAFRLGGSGEEFNLPGLALGVYAVLRRFHEGENCAHPARLYALFGAAMGWVFLIKFTNCGLFFGLALAALLYEWRLRGFLAAVRSGLWCVVGLALVCLPVAVYLGIQGALGDMLEVYFYENIFFYSEPMSFLEHVKNALMYLRKHVAFNPVMAALAILGVVFATVRPLLRRKKGWLFEAIALPLGRGCYCSSHIGAISAIVTMRWCLRRFPRWPSVPWRRWASVFLGAKLRNGWPVRSPSRRWWRPCRSVCNSVLQRRCALSSRRTWCRAILPASSFRRRNRRCLT